MHQQFNINTPLYRQILNSNARRHCNDSITNPMKGYSMKILSDIYDNLPLKGKNILLYTNSPIQPGSIKQLAQKGDNFFITSQSDEVLKIQKKNLNNCTATKVYYICCSEDQQCLANESITIAVSDLSLHLAHDIRVAISNYAKMLKSDGILIANILGGKTLCECGMAMMQADLHENRMVTRMLPMISSDGLLNITRSCGFNYVIATSESSTFTYSSIGGMVESFREIGQIYPSQLFSSHEHPYVGKKYWNDVQRIMMQNSTTISITVEFITLFAVK